MELNNNKFTINDKFTIVTNPDIPDLTILLINGEAFGGVKNVEINLSINNDVRNMEITLFNPVSEISSKDTKLQKDTVERIYGLVKELKECGFDVKLSNPEAFKNEIYNKDDSTVFSSDEDKATIEVSKIVNDLLKELKN